MASFHNTLSGEDAGDGRILVASYVFFAEDFATYGSSKGFVKVACRNKAHLHCGCWVQPRGSNIPSSGNALLSDCIRWAADGHSGTSLAHRQTAFDVKVKYGMKPKGGRPF